MNFAEWGAPATVVALIAALGVGQFGPKLIARLWEWVTGRARRQRSEVDRLYRELDTESAHRRRLQEALSATRIIAREHGVPDDRLPPFPGRPDATRPDAHPVEENTR